jgi:hypothetical protein
MAKSSVSAASSTEAPARARAGVYCPPLVGRAVDPVSQR